MNRLAAFAFGDRDSLRRVFSVMVIGSVFAGIFAFTLCHYTSAQQPGPPPRVVSPRPMPAWEDVHNVQFVQVFRDGEYVGQFSAQSQSELEELLYTLALRFCTAPREWVKVGDSYEYRKPAGKIEVAIFDSYWQDWRYPDPKKPTRREFFALPLTVTVNAGSHRIE